MAGIYWRYCFILLGLNLTGVFLSLDNSFIIRRWFTYTVAARNVWRRARCGFGFGLYSLSACLRELALTGSDSASQAGSTHGILKSSRRHAAPHASPPRLSRDQPGKFAKVREDADWRRALRFGISFVLPYPPAHANSP
jgi:hypothetical protein